MNQRTSSKYAQARVCVPVCVCVCLRVVQLPEGKVMINSTGNSSILPKSNIKRVVPPLPPHIPLDVYFLWSGRSINFRSAKGFHLLTWWQPERLSPSPSPDGVGGVGLVSWTGTGSLAAQATRLIVCPTNPSPNLGRGDGGLVCLLLVPNFKLCHSPPGLSRWGKIQEVNKEVGRVGERVGQQQLGLDSRSLEWPAQRVDWGTSFSKQSCA